MLLPVVLALFFISDKVLVASALPRVPMLDNRIVGGTPANIQEAPYQAALMYDYWDIGKFDHVCGAVIVGKNSALTAAHCLIGTSDNRLKTRTTSNYHDSSGVIIGVSKSIIHPDFNERMDNDIALLIMGANFILGQTAAIATLPSWGQTAADGSDAFITGWGMLNEIGLKPDILFKVTVPVVNQAKCVDAYASVNPVTENMICAGNLETGAQDACVGDGGGPMIVNGFLFGVTSWGSGCARPGYPGVYTRVSNYRQWLEDECEKYWRDCKLQSQT